MSTTTQCPACGTRFKASQQQLEAFHGMVRCGHCHAAFNAVENRISSEGTPQLNLPIVEEDASPQEVPDTPPTKRKAEQVRLNLTSSRPSGEVEQAETEPAGSHKGAWIAGNVLLVIILLGQLTYLFRVELAARLPGIKPALVAACETLQCSVPLPHEINDMAIETSNMESDPAQPGVITLTVVLHNLADYAQAYPNLELTLTDMGDNPVGRRILMPEEYLKDPANAETGLAGHRENEVRLAIDASSLKPVGYQLFLTYEDVSKQ